MMIMMMIMMKRMTMMNKKDLAPFEPLGRPDDDDDDDNVETDRIGTF